MEWQLVGQCGDCPLFLMIPSTHVMSHLCTFQHEFLKVPGMWLIPVIPYRFSSHWHTVDLLDDIGAGGFNVWLISSLAGLMDLNSWGTWVLCKKPFQLSQFCLNWGKWVLASDPSIAVQVIPRHLVLYVICYLCVLFWRTYLNNTTYYLMLGIQLLLL